MSYKKMMFKEENEQFSNFSLTYLTARCNEPFIYWETASHHGLEKMDIAPANTWVPCNIANNNISTAWRIYWKNNQKI